MDPRNTRTLWCLMQSTLDPVRAFPVKCPFGETIHSLKQLIRIHRQSLLHDIDTADIVLYSFKGDRNDLLVNFTLRHHLQLSPKCVVDSSFPPPNEICDLIVVLPTDNRDLSVDSSEYDASNSVAMSGKKRMSDTQDDVEVQSQRPKLFKSNSFRYQVLFDALGRISDSLDDYCDPAISQMLPFPFTGEIPSTRFPLDQHGMFQYYGREKFKELYLMIQKRNFQQTRMYYLHGTLGAGKSHLLAALTCLLIKEGHKVVYLPDCRALLRDPFSYIRGALRLTFHDHTQRATFLDDCETLQQLERFCYEASSEFRLLFIIDQANALYPEEEGADQFSLTAKHNTRTLLDKITSQHLKLESSSGNYQHTLFDIYRATDEKRLQVYGGLSHTEIERWWLQKSKSLVIADEEKHVIEDVTGSVPILLNALCRIIPEIDSSDSIDSSISRRQGRFRKILRQLALSPEAQNMIAKVKLFANRREKALQSSQELLDFRAAVFGCIIGDILSLEFQNLLDWQHFYVSDGIGSPICALVRTSAAEYLRNVSPAQDFLSPKWFDNLEAANQNPSVLGFFIEQMLLSWITLNGCPAAGKEFTEKPKTVLFSTAHPLTTPPESGFTLYILTSYHYQSVDAILLNLDLASHPASACIVGIKIMTTKCHSNFETLFFQEWHRWVEKLKLLAKNVKFRFLWVYEDIDIGPSSRQEDIPQITTTLRRSEKISRPAFTRMVTAVSTVSPDIGRRLRVVRSR
ncbi:hypothetical protein EV426DRAFT_622182 [Tirmania nivea]|nr:hypothetical protein EV426DRAFT_622182 [Tirmania nivea]